MRNSPDEIDLMVVFQYFGSLFQRILNRINYTIRAIRNHAIVVLGCIAIGMGLAYGLYAITKPFYNSSMTLMLANIRNEFIEEQLLKLSSMIDEGNVEAVAERLDISPDAARSIREMKFSNLDDNRIDEDSVLTGSPFRIELSLYDRELFESMEPALTNYIENNRYFAKQKRIKQKQVEDMISKLRGEITSIDSLKTNSVEPRGPVNGFVYGQPIDPTNLFRESITLYKEQVQLEASLERLDNVEVVSGFIPKLRPTGPNMLKYLAIGGAIAFLIGMIAALNLENKK